MTTRSALLISFAAIAGCGDNIVPGPDAGFAGTPDGGTFKAVPTTDQPQVQIGSGKALATPVVVPIFFANDALQAQQESFLAALATSSYWHLTTSEYGIGALTIAPSIVSTDQAPTTDTALQTWLAANLDGTHADWGTFDPNAIYSVHLPDGVVIDAGGGAKSCQSFGGYHDEVTITGKPSITYALLPRCSGGIDTLTVVTSHELVEAASDPLPQTATAWGDHMDDNHMIWAFTPGAELGDMCEYVHSAEQRIVGTFAVQRTWSNKSAAHGHDPCVPVMAAPYVVGIPDLSEDVSMDDGNGGKFNTKGVSVPVGTSKTIAIDLYSDAPAPPFTIKAIDAGALGGGGQELAFSLDHDTGSSGDRLMLTITRQKKATFGFSEFIVSSRVNGTSVSLWWGLVAN